MAEEQIRPSNRGIVVADDKVLLIRVLDKEYEYFILPGGKHEFGETSIETVERECEEELGCTVSVGNCVLIREFIGPRRHDVMSTVANMHIKELYFLCEPVTLPDLKLREREQKEIVWIPISEIGQKDLKPAYVRNNILSLIERGKSGMGALYVGDVD